MIFREIDTAPYGLKACAALLSVAFPGASHLSSEYLGWLYRDNPAGKVLGFDAWEKGQLIAHYAAVPVDLLLDGAPARGLLALNTAVHPDFQGVGTIYSLVNRTCKLATQSGFDCIYAVANAASTPLLVKSLKFQQVAQLTVTLGLGQLEVDWNLALEENRFRRSWSEETIRWRINNPASHTSALRRPNGCLRFAAGTPLPLVTAIGELPPASSALEDFPGGHSPLIKLFLGLMPPGSYRSFGHFSIPERLKPSPLNFVYRPLSGAAPRQLQRKDVVLGVQDFDAY